MDDGTKAQIREMIREADVNDQLLQRITTGLQRRFWLLSRIKAAFVAGSALAFLGAVGVVGYQSAAAAVAAKINEREVDRALDRLIQKTERAASWADNGLPLGSIIAWHSNILKRDKPVDDDLLQLEIGDDSAWLPCDGTVLTRDEHGETYKSLFAAIPSDVNRIEIPDLNGKGRFLRGASQSGELQNSAVGPHTHKHDLWKINGPKGFEVGPESVPWETDEWVPDIRVGGDDETRPINMSVVWIIRVK